MRISHGIFTTFLGHNMKVEVAEYGIEQIIEFFNHVISSRASL